MIKRFTLLALGAGAGWLLSLLQVPVAWLLGAMLIGVAAAARDWVQPLHPGYATVGQAVVGLSVGVSFPLQTLQSAAEYAVPLLAVVVITGSLSMLMGYLLWRWGGVDPATGFLGALPGAAPAMVAMSDELGADPMAVALLQYLRLMMVVSLAPLAVGTLFPDTGAVVVATAAPEAVATMAPPILNLGLLAVIAFLGVRGGRRWRMPSPTFLGPLLVGLIVSWTIPWQLTVPPWLFNLALLLVGTSIGLRFDLPAIRNLGKAALIESILVLGLITASLGVGYAFHTLTGVDSMTAVLGSTPGGMDVMVATAVELGGDPAVVLAMQMTRWLLVLLTGPWVTTMLVKATGGTASGLESQKVRSQ